MKSLLKIPVAASIFAILAAVSACSTTAPTRGKSVPQPQAKLAKGSADANNRRTLEPFSHVVFCHKYPGECAASNGPARIELTLEKRQELERVNREVNSQIRPKNDNGDDVWTLAPRSGDCEDYAITKRHVLIKRGWPASALLLAEGFTASGEGHLALVVRTSKGDIVLDNVTDTVLGWNQAGLRWQKIQSSTSPRIWEKA
jgi:predicted transglutaminase-like cysteine proteinase